MLSPLEHTRVNHFIITSGTHKSQSFYYHLWNTQESIICYQQIPGTHTRVNNFVIIHTPQEYTRVNHFDLINKPLEHTQESISMLSSTHLWHTEHTRANHYVIIHTPLAHRALKSQSLCYHPHTSGTQNTQESIIMLSSTHLWALAHRTNKRQSLCYHPHTSDTQNTQESIIAYVIIHTPLAHRTHKSQSLPMLSSTNLCNTPSRYGLVNDSCFYHWN